MDKKLFIDILNRQLDFLKELLALLEQETVAMTELNLQSMETLNQQKAETAENVEMQLVHLRQALSEYAAGRKLSSAVSLGEVVSLCDDKELSKIHMNLNTVAQRVQDVAAMNREIAERFAETASTSLNLLMRVINQSSMYGASGGYQQRPTGSIMINREA